MEIKMIPHDTIEDFILAGKSIFTVKNPKTENRFTYKVSKSKNGDLYFVSALTSPDHYEFIGTLFDKVNFSHSKKSIIDPNSQISIVFKWILNKVKTKSIPEYIQVWHSGKCGRCGRNLTTPDSIDSGYGPECIKLIKK